jgi:hypothetical protein
MPPLLIVLKTQPAKEFVHIELQKSSVENPSSRASGLGKLPSYPGYIRAPLVSGAQRR